MTRYESHKQRWGKCRLCSLCEGRSRVVLARGTIPCDVLFIGEAPGVSEDVIGQPFVGPAGQLLDKIIAQAWDGKYTSPENRGWDTIDFAMTNLVACFPEEQKKTEDHQPPVESIKACAPRLREFVAMANPKLIVMVGALAQKWVPQLLDRKWMAKTCSILHPAAILRAPLVQRGLLVQRCIIALTTAVQGI